MKKTAHSWLLPVLFLIPGLFIANVTTAQYTLGNRTETFIDSSRANRPIETEIFYPADIPGYGVPFAAPFDKKFPVIVVGHDYLLNWNEYAYIWNFFVEKGFIVALPKTEAGFAPDHTEFAKDMAFVVSEFARMRTDPASPYYKRTNGKSCVMGHGMGGGAAVLSIQYNPAITTLVTLAASETSPSAITESFNITIPAVVVAGALDCISPVATNQLPMYNNLASTCKAFISINQSNHCQFAQNAPNCIPDEMLCNGGITPPYHVLTNRITNYYVVSWLRYYMKYNAPALAKFEWKLLQKPDKITYDYYCGPNSPRIMGEATEEDPTFFLNMYPNPAQRSGTLNLTIPSEEASRAVVMIADLLGQVVVSEQLELEEDFNEFALPLDNLSKGYYLVTVTNSVERVTKPLIIE